MYRDILKFLGLCLCVVVIAVSTVIRCNRIEESKAKTKLMFDNPKEYNRKYNIDTWEKKFERHVKK